MSWNNSQRLAAWSSPLCGFGAPAADFDRAAQLTKLDKLALSGRDRDGMKHWSRIPGFSTDPNIDRFL
jgi:hypothetical protein